MNCMESFSASYREARDKFREAVSQARGQLDCLTHPERSPDGGDLSTDVAWIGPRDAQKVLVTISGTHGVEGFAGSGAQVDWLRRGETARLPSNFAALLIHAINPYGFAWLRRVTHENVDLNRNWIDFARPLPENPAYDELASSVCPTEWTDAARLASGKVLLAYAARHGEAGQAKLQHAVSGGQYRHPAGLFYGGRAPTWSRQTQTQIFSTYLALARKIAIIDFHTGLGPWGLGERIVSAPRGSAGFDRAGRWYGKGITSPYDGTSTSAPIVGDGLSASAGLLPHAEVTGMALEFGTVPVMEVLDALRADAWLHSHGDPASDAGRAIKAQIRSAFYVETTDWKGMIAGQALLACRQAIAGLSD
ncbi:MAG: M14 family metallopeptidase [Steroidobacteraceae bacterium]